MNVLDYAQVSRHKWTAKRKVQLIKRIIPHLVAATLLTLAAGAFISWGLIALASGDPFRALCCSLLSAVLVVLFTSSILYNCLSAYSDFLIMDQNFARLDVVLSRSLQLIQRLPILKPNVEVPLLQRYAAIKLFIGEYDSAQQAYSTALALAKKDSRAGFRHAFIALFYSAAVTYIRRAKYIEAAQALEEAFDLMRQTKCDRSVFAGLLFFCRAALNTAQEEYALVENDLEKAKVLLETGDNSFPLDTETVKRSVVQTYLTSALIYLRIGQIDKSNAQIEHYLECVRCEPDLVQLPCIKALNDLANELIEKQEYKRAESLLEVSYYLSHTYPLHPDAAITLDTYQRLLTDTSRAAEVEDMRHWLRPAGLMGKSP